MSKVHVCLDLETLSLRSDAVITAIGAVAWETPNPTIGDFFSKFECKLSLDQPGRHMDPSTVAWWLRQSDEARKHAFGGETSLGAAFIYLRNWLEGIGEDGIKDVYVWTNDPSFDAAILKSANGGDSPPWYYRNTRCVRTASDLVSELEYQDLKERLEITPHYALDDARLSGAVVQTYQKRVADLLWAPSVDGGAA